MKRVNLILLAMLTTTLAFGQDITGQWNGMLKVQGIQLRIVFHINKADDGYTATMDSPDQGATGLPVTSVTFENPKLTLKVSNAGIEYTGEFKDDVIKGTFKQATFSTEMDLQRQALEKVEVRHPQEPVKPYPYSSEDVKFDNPVAEGVTLAGTLTLPKEGGKFPVAILISGSGRQNRDEELLGQKPFLVLSDYLTRHGIAVLRYDDRGVAQSTGDFSKATTADFATDVEAAIAYLKTRPEIDPKHIGLIGHSEGGIIAPMVAARSKDVAFIVMMAGTGMPGRELLPLQAELIGRASGMSEEELKTSKEINTHIFNLVAKTPDLDKLRPELKSYLQEVVGKLPASEKPKGVSDEDFIQTQINQVANPWMVYFLNYDPIPALKKVKCPVLVLNGDKDLQVPSKENLPLIRKALKHNHSAEIVEFPGMNHLFQECTTGSPDEYAKIEETLSPKMLKVTTDWIGKVVKQ
jgi:pimeloyl-ACP methyl ester carboxylesterase